MNNTLQKKTKDGRIKIENKKTEVAKSKSDYISDESDENEIENEKDEYREEFYGEYPYYLGIGPWTSEADIVKGIDDSRVLSSIESASMICLIEDAINELVILKYIIAGPLVSTYNFRYKTLQERFTRKVTPNRIFPEVDSNPDLTSTIKLQKDREHIEITLRKTLKTLMMDGSYEVLVTALKEVEQEEEDELNLIASLKENLKYLQELRVKVNEKRRLDDQEEKERDEFTYRLKDEIDDILLKCRMEERFVNKWENVRNAQNRLKLQKVENFYRNGITDFVSKMRTERRVAQELQLYIRTNQAELEETLEEWMTFYDAETERRENKILQLNYSRDHTEEKKHQLQQVYEERKMEMKEWITFRDNRRRKSQASLQIQSWWRGIMVRKKLGPYKPKKPK